MSKPNIFDTNEKLNEAKKKLVSDFTNKLTFNSLCAPIEPCDTLDLKKSLADEFRKSAEFSKLCDEIRSKVDITDTPYNFLCAREIKFDDIYCAYLIPEDDDSIFRKYKYGSITERWHLFLYDENNKGTLIGNLTPNDTNFDNEDEVLAKLTNMVAQSKLNDSLGLRSGYLTCSGLEI